jgi:hypothetical protein
MEDSIIHIVFALWSGSLTVLGVLIMWIWNRLIKQVDDKVDKYEVEQLRKDLQERWVTQDKMHRENRVRLDRIFERVVNHRN